VPHQSPALQLNKLKVLYKAGALAGEIGEMVAAAALGAGEADPHLQHEITTTDAVLDEFLGADIIVLGAPMYNFSIPSQLKAWIDCLAAPGKTFRYTEHGVEGLVSGKRVIIASSRGGIYTAPSPMAALDHQESYLTPASSASLV